MDLSLVMPPGAVVFAGLRRQAVHWAAFTWGAGWQGERLSPGDGQPESERLKAALQVGRVEPQTKQLPAPLSVVRRSSGTSQPHSFVWDECFGSNLCPHAEGSWGGADGELSAEELGFSFGSVHPMEFLEALKGQRKPSP